MDVWSLGCVIYELCTLKPPFTDTNSIHTSQPIPITNFTGLSILHLLCLTYYDYVYLLYVSDFNAIIMQMLNKDPSQRITLTQLFSHPSIIQHANQLHIHIPQPTPPSNTSPITLIASNIITSLDGTTVIFAPNNDGIKREGNTIIHYGSKSFRNCFIGGEMRSV